ncbi:MAG: gamma subclass chorismate mutase AroQ [Steroidobacteraceae bacterium]
MALALAVLLAVTTAHAAGAALSGVLRVGSPGDYAPYSWYDTATETYRGSDVELVRALALQLGLRVQFVRTTWATLVTDAQAGSFDIAIGGISVTAERQRVVDFSTRYVSDRKQPVVRCGDQKRFDTVAEINQPQVRLIVNAGGTNERFARENFPAATLIVHGDNRTVFDEIRADRADVMVTDAVEGRLQQRAQQGLCVAAVRTVWAPAEKAMMIQRESLQKDVVDAGLARLGGKRRYKREQSEWEGYDWINSATPSVQLAALVDERLAVVTEVARAKWNAQAAIEDPVREQALLQSMRERAATLGVSAALVDRFFGAQIEAAKLLQRELFAQWRRQHQGQFAGVADLVRDIRPAIDQVTSRMLEQLALLPGNHARPLPAASTLSLVSPAALRTAREPLVTVVKELK